MIKEGFILLSRQLLESKLWSCSDATFRVAIYLLLSANHAPKWFKRVEIKRGQSCRSLGRIADDCGLSVKAVRYALKILKKDGFILIDSPFGAYRGHRITILKYDTYQDPDSYKGKPGASQGSSQGTSQGSTNNNVIMKEYIYMFDQLAPSEKTKVIEDVYLSYPKQAKEVKAKRAIAKALSKGLINYKDLQKIVKQFAIAISWMDLKFIPYCDSWIEDQRWKDDPQTWKEPERIANKSKPEQAKLFDESDYQDEF